MKILIESHSYSDEIADRYFSGFFTPKSQEEKKTRNILDFVGYHYNKDVGDCVFFLPRVLLKGDGKNITVLDENVSPDEIVDIDENKLSKEFRTFIKRLSVWLYRSIDIYQKRKGSSSAVYRSTLSELNKSNSRRDSSLLDIHLALIDFAEKHKDYVMFIAKNVHSGFNKVNWAKTVANKQPFFQGDSPLYHEVVNRKKAVNYDEELLIIFYSIINYLNKEYGHECRFEVNYELITGHKFQLYIRSLGKTRLRQIKHKYFSDIDLEMWNLCYSFFDIEGKIRSSKTQEDYLIITKYNNVFEDMIDELLGEEEIKDMKKQDDGKIIDHIYRYGSLLRNTDFKQTYYIADSKYYKEDKTGGHSVGLPAEYKQYTYAKNIIQYNLNLLLSKKDKDKKKSLKYRDDYTEGYNITPNFFISGQLEKENDGAYSYRNMHLSKENGQERKMVQFENRLFDRDTLWLSHYNINFLYVLALYANGSNSAKLSFKNTAQSIFKEHMFELLNNHYYFFALECKDGMEENVNRCFKHIVGRTFVWKDNLLYFAWEHQKKKNATILYSALAEKDSDFSKTLSKIADDFKITEESFVLGKEENNYLNFVEINPITAKVEEQEEQDHYSVSIMYDADNLHEFLQKKKDAQSETIRFELYGTKAAEPSDCEHILVGCFKEFNHLRWIANKGLYNIRTGDREGAIGSYERQNVDYLLLYNFNNPDDCFLFRLAKEITMGSETLMRALSYPDYKSGNKYVLYTLDSACAVPKGLDVKAILEERKPDNWIEGKPFYAELDEELIMKLGLGNVVRQG